MIEALTFSNVLGLALIALGWVTIVRVLRGLR